MKLSKIIAISFILYCIVYAFALNPDYVEGDDASNIAYHALGRNSEIQLPYSDYHGMMDVVLSVFPADETIVRYIGILLTSFCTWLMYILMMLIAFHLTQKDNRNTQKWALLTIPFIAPEFLFIGLTYTPAVVAMCFVLSAHYLIIKQSDFSLTNPKLYLSILLFGLGVSFRWDTGFYLFLIGMERLFYKKINIQYIFNLTVVCLLTLVTTYVFISLTGSNYETILLHLREKSRYASSGSFSLISLMGNISFFTPALLFLFLLGLIKAFNTKNFLHLFFAASTLLFIFPIVGMGIFDSGTLKRIFCITPILLSTIIIGYDYLLNNNSKLKYFFFGILITFSLAFGLIGLQIYSDTTIWGPGFETRITCDKNQLSSYKIEDKNNVSGVKIAFNSGFVYMSEEGPRPIGGFLFTLFNDWRKFNKSWNFQKNTLIDTALKYKLPILQEKETQYLTAYFCRRGFTTVDPACTGGKLYRLTHDRYARRIFFNSIGDKVVLINFQGDYKNSFLDSLMLKELKIISGGKILIHAQYATTIRKLCAQTNKKFKVIVYSPFTAMIEFLDV